MNYQGEQVNFSQSDAVTTDLYNGIIRINRSLYQYPQEDNLSSAKSDTDIWNHINRYIWGKSGAESSPKGNWAADPNAAFPQINKGIMQNKNKNTSQDDSINANKMQIESMNIRLSKQVTDLGNALSGKAGKNHTHSGGGGGITQYIPLMAVGGIAAYLLKGKLK